MADPGWTDERIFTLKGHFEAGLTASQIEAEFKGIFSRSAVIGKLHRLGLKRREVAGFVPRKTAPVKSRPQPPSPERHLKNIAAAAKFDASEVIVAEDAEIPQQQRTTLMDLNDAMCHWPVGDPSSPDFFFCGGKALSGLPYCGQHARVAYQPNERRR